MVTIRVFGPTPPCAKCKRAEREALKAAEGFSGEVEVLKIDALGEEADRYGVIATPTIAIDDEIVGSGKIVRSEDLVPHIERHLGV